MAQEGLNSIKTKNKKALTLQADLSKAFDLVSWLYIRLILIHLGFSHGFVTRVMSYTNLTSFTNL